MLGWSHITHIILTCQIQRSTDGANLFQVQLWDVAYTWWHSGIPNPFQTNVYKRVLKKLAIQATNKGYNTNTCQKAKWQKEYFLLITVTSLANRSMFKYFFLILGYRDIFKNGFYQRKKLCQITQYTSIIVILDLIYIHKYYDCTGLPLASLLQHPPRVSITALDKCISQSSMSKLRLFCHWVALWKVAKQEPWMRTNCEFGSFMMFWHLPNPRMDLAIDLTSSIAKLKHNVNKFLDLSTPP